MSEIIYNMLGAASPKILASGWNEQLFWNFHNLSAYHWRAYWHRGQGSEIELAEQVFRPDDHDLVLIAPRTPFAARYTGSQKNPAHQLWVHFVLDDLNLAVENRLYRIPCPEELRERLDGIVTGRFSGFPVPSFLCWQMVSTCLAAVPGQDWQQSAADPKIQAVLDLMERELTNSFSNEELAMKSGLSDSTFYRLFKQEIGMTPQQYQIKARLDRASELLIHTHLSIETIAEQCGFVERNYFSRLFAAKKAVPPAAYRKQEREILAGHVDLHNMPKRVP